MTRRPSASTDSSANVPVGYEPIGLDSARRFDFAGASWGVQNAGRSWSALTQPGKVRFEVRRGDPGIAADVGCRDRSEIAHPVRQPFGVAVVVSYSARLSTGSAPAAWSVLNQFHATPDKGEADLSPPFALELTPNNDFRIWRRWIEGGLQQERMALRPAIRGSWFHVVQRIVFAPDLTGETTFWLNGWPLYDRKGLKTAYPDVLGPYWKMGVYRAIQSPGLSIEYANFEIGGDDLLCRISAPLTVT